jgi:hypothetical protein
MDDGAAKLDAFFRETGFGRDAGTRSERRSSQRGGQRGLLAAVGVVVLATVLWNLIR